MKKQINLLKSKSSKLTSFLRRMESDNLHRASKRGDLVAVKRHLAQDGADINLRDNWSGETALHCTSEEGHLEIVKFLVESGADKDAKGSKDWTPLHFASRDGHMEIVKFLVEIGADKEAKDDEGWTPLIMLQKKATWKLSKF